MKRKKAHFDFLLKIVLFLFVLTSFSYFVPHYLNQAYALVGGGVENNGSGSGGNWSPNDGFVTGNGGQANGGSNTSGTVATQNNTSTSTVSNIPGVGNVAYGSSCPGNCVGSVPNSPAFNGANFVQSGNGTWLEVENNIGGNGGTFTASNGQTVTCNRTSPTVCSTTCGSPPLQVQVGTCTDGYPMYDVCPATAACNIPTPPPPPTCGIGGGIPSITVGQTINFFDASSSQSPIWFQDWNASGGFPLFQHTGGTFAWTPSTPGVYSITHTISNTDNYGRTCSPYTVTVTAPNAPPTANINILVNGQQKSLDNSRFITVVATDNVQFQVNAADATGDLVRGDMYYRYANGDPNQWIGGAPFYPTTPGSNMSGANATITSPRVSWAPGLYAVMTNIGDTVQWCTGNPSYHGGIPSATRCNPNNQDYIIVQVIPQLDHACTVKVNGTPVANQPFTVQLITDPLHGATPTNQIRFVLDADSTNTQNSSIVSLNAPNVDPYNPTNPLLVPIVDVPFTAFFLPGCYFRVNGCNPPAATIKLPAGSYYLHCDMPLDNGYVSPPAKCSGNPYCNGIAGSCSDPSSPWAACIPGNSPANGYYSDAIDASTGRTDRVHFTVSAPVVPTPTLAIPPWFKTTDGSTHANGDIVNPSNASQPAASNSTVTYGRNQANFQANPPLDFQYGPIASTTYQTLRNGLKKKPTQTTNPNTINANGAYLFDNGNASQEYTYQSEYLPNTTPNGKYVFFVNGNLSINNSPPSGQSVAFIVSGNVTFASTLTTFNGIVFANGAVYTNTTGNPSSDPLLTVNGMIIGNGGVALQRKTAGKSEDFSYNAKLLWDLKDYLGTSKNAWQEVNP